MNLTELKKKPIGELIKIAEFMGLEGMARNRKQDIIFAILKRHAMNGEEIFGDGVLEILSYGFGFLRSAEGGFSIRREFLQIIFFKSIWSHSELFS